MVGKLGERSPQSWGYCAVEGCREEWRRDKETSKLGGVGEGKRRCPLVFSPPRVYHCPFPFFSLTFISL